MWLSAMVARASMIFVFVLPLALVLASAITRFKSTFSSMPLWSPYECGFLGLSHSHRSFSLYFFQLCLLFIIFDAEILILMPLPEFQAISALSVSSLFVFLVVLTWGLYHEWREGALAVSS